MAERQIDAISIGISANLTRLKESLDAASSQISSHRYPEKVVNVIVKAKIDKEAIKAEQQKLAASIEQLEKTNSRQIVFTPKWIGVKASVEKLRNEAQKTLNGKDIAPINVKFVPDVESAKAFHNSLQAAVKAAGPVLVQVEWVAPSMPKPGPGGGGNAAPPSGGSPARPKGPQPKPGPIGGAVPPTPAAQHATAQPAAAPRQPARPAQTQPKQYTTPPPQPGPSDDAEYAVWEDDYTGPAGPSRRHVRKRIGPSSRGTTRPGVAMPESLLSRHQGYRVPGVSNATRHQVRQTAKRGVDQSRFAVWDESAPPEPEWVSQQMAIPDDILGGIASATSEQLFNNLVKNRRAELERRGLIFNPEMVEGVSSGQVLGAKLRAAQGNPRMIFSGVRPGSEFARNPKKLKEILDRASGATPMGVRVGGAGVPGNGYRTSGFSGSAYRLADQANVGRTGQEEENIQLDRLINNLIYETGERRSRATAKEKSSGKGAKAAFKSAAGFLLPYQTIANALEGRATAGKLEPNDIQALYEIIAGDPTKVTVLHPETGDPIPWGKMVLGDETRTPNVREALFALRMANPNQFFRSVGGVQPGERVGSALQGLVTGMTGVNDLVTGKSGLIARNNDVTTRDAERRQLRSNKDLWKRLSGMSPEEQVAAALKRHPHLTPDTAPGWVQSFLSNPEYMPKRILGGGHLFPRLSEKRQVAYLNSAMASSLYNADVGVRGRAANILPIAQRVENLAGRFPYTASHIVGLRSVPGDVMENVLGANPTKVWGWHDPGEVENPLDPNGPGLTRAGRIGLNEEMLKADPDYVRSRIGSAVASGHWPSTTRDPGDIAAHEWAHAMDWMHGDLHSRSARWTLPYVSGYSGDSEREHQADVFAYWDRAHILPNTWAPSPYGSDEFFSPTSGEIMDKYSLSWGLGTHGARGLTTSPHSLASGGVNATDYMQELEARDRWLYASEPSQIKAIINQTGRDEDIRRLGMRGKQLFNAPGPGWIIPHHLIDKIPGRILGGRIPKKGGKINANKRRLDIRSGQAASFSYEDRALGMMRNDPEHRWDAMRAMQDLWQSRAGEIPEDMRVAELMQDVLPGIGSDGLVNEDIVDAYNSYSEAPGLIGKMLMRASASEMGELYNPSYHSGNDPGDLPFAISGTVDPSRRRGLNVNHRLWWSRRNWLNSRAFRPPPAPREPGFFTNALRDNPSRLPHANPYQFEEFGTSEPEEMVGIAESTREAIEVGGAGDDLPLGVSPYQIHPPEQHRLLAETFPIGKNGVPFMEWNRNQLGGPFGRQRIPKKGGKLNAARRYLDVVAARDSANYLAKRAEQVFFSPQGRWEAMKAVEQSSAAHNPDTSMLGDLFTNLDIDLSKDRHLVHENWVDVNNAYESAPGWVNQILNQASYADSEEVFKPAPVARWQARSQLPSARDLRRSLRSPLVPREPGFDTKARVNREMFANQGMRDIDIEDPSDLIASSNDRRWDPCGNYALEGAHTYYCPLHPDYKDMLDRAKGKGYAMPRVDRIQGYKGNDADAFKPLDATNRLPYISKNALGGHIPHRMKGGSIDNLTWVGEAGPELFVPESMGWIIPRDVMDQLPKREAGGPIGTPQAREMGVAERMITKMVTRLKRNDPAFSPKMMAHPLGEGEKTTSIPPLDMILDPYMPYQMAHPQRASDYPGRVGPRTEPELPMFPYAQAHQVNPDEPVQYGPKYFGFGGQMPRKREPMAHFIGQPAPEPGVASEPAAAAANGGVVVPPGGTGGSGGGGGLGGGGNVVQVEVVNWPESFGGAQAKAAQGTITQKERRISKLQATDNAAGMGKAMKATLTGSTEPAPEAPTPGSPAMTMPHDLTAVQRAVIKAASIERQFGATSPRSEIRAAEESIKQSLQITSNRAVSTQTGQALSVIGPRGGIQERARAAEQALQKQRAYANEVEKTQTRMAELEEEITIGVKGGQDPDQMKKLRSEHEDLTDSLKVFAQGEKDAAEEAQRLTKAVAPLGSKLGAMVTNTVGVAAGMTAFSGVMAVMNVALQTGAQMWGPAIDRGTSFINTSNEVAKTLGSSVREMRGAEDAAIAMTTAQTGMSKATADTIAPLLKQRGVIESGNQAFSEQLTLINSANQFRVQNLQAQAGLPIGPMQPAGGLAGITRSTGGFMGTPIGATPSLFEQVAQQGGTSGGQNFTRDIVNAIGSVLPGFANGGLGSDLLTLTGSNVVKTPEQIMAMPKGLGSDQFQAGWSSPFDLSGMSGKTYTVPDMSGVKSVRSPRAEENTGRPIQDAFGWLSNVLGPSYSVSGLDTVDIPSYLSGKSSASGIGADKGWAAMSGVSGKASSNDLIENWGSLTDDQKIAATQTINFTASLDALSSSAKKGASNIQLLKKGQDGYNEALKAGADVALEAQIGPDTYKAIHELGYVMADITKPGRKLETKDIAQFGQGAQIGSSRMDPALLMQQAMQYQIPAAIRDINRRAEYDIGKRQPAEYALQRLANPIIPYAEDPRTKARTVTGQYGGTPTSQAQIMKSMDSQFASQQSAADKYAEMYGVKVGGAQKVINDQFAKGKSLLEGMNFPPGMLDDIQMYGKAIVDINKNLTQKETNLQVASYSNQLRLVNRSLRDARDIWRGIKGAAGDTYGLIEGQNIRLGRQLQLLGFELSQRQISFQLATAGFVAPGQTPEEIAARIKEAKIEADYAQRQLDLQKQIASGQYKQTGIGVSRSVTDLAAQADLVRAERSLVQETANAQAALTQLTEARDVLVTQAQTLLQSQISLDGILLDQLYKIESETGELLDTQVAAISKAWRDAAKSYEKDYLHPIRSDIEAIFGFTVYGTGGGGGGGGGGGHKVNAPGFIGRIGTPTTMTVGEAGSEEVAILRNPRTLTVGAAGQSEGGGPIQIIFNNPVVRSDADISTIIRLVEASLMKKTAMFGLRRPS